MTGSEDWSFSSTADEVVKAFQDRVGGRTCKAKINITGYLG